MSLKERAKQLKTDIPAVYLAFKHKRTPWYAKFIALLTIGYALSPIDLIPDFIPVIGYLDDIILLPAMVALVIRMIPKEVMEECRKNAVDMWKDGKPKKWYYGIPIILIWVFVIVLILKIIL